VSNKLHNFSYMPKNMGDSPDTMSESSTEGEAPEAVGRNVKLEGVEQVSTSVQDRLHMKDPVTATYASDDMDTSSSSSSDEDDLFGDDEKEEQKRLRRQYKKRKRENDETSTDKPSTARKLFRPPRAPKVHWAKCSSEEVSASIIVSIFHKVCLVTYHSSCTTISSTITSTAHLPPSNTRVQHEPQCSTERGPQAKR